MNSVLEENRKILFPQRYALISEKSLLTLFSDHVNDLYISIGLIKQKTRSERQYLQKISFWVTFQSWKDFHNSFCTGLAVYHAVLGEVLIYEKNSSPLIVFIYKMVFSSHAHEYIFVKLNKSCWLNICP